MKNLKKNRRDLADEAQESMELLFGAETDLSDAELDAELDAVGVDGAALQRKAHEHLKALAEHHFISLDREVPAEMNQAIAQFRPPTAEQQAQDEKQMASGCIETIVSAAKAAKDGIKQARSTIVKASGSFSNAAPQFAFRNQTDLAASDLDILNLAQAELDEGLSSGSDSEGKKA